MVDLSFTATDIDREFGFFLRKWKPPTTGKIRLNRGQKVKDIWKVYEECVIKKRNLTEVTIDLLHLRREDHPKEKDYWGAAYQEVKNARKKTRSILEEVEKQAEKRAQ